MPVARPSLCLINILLLPSLFGLKIHKHVYIKPIIKFHKRNSSWKTNYIVLRYEITALHSSLFKTASLSQSLITLAMVGKV